MTKRETELKIYLPLLGSLILIFLIFNFFTINLLEVYKSQEIKIRKIKEDLAIFTQKEEILNNYNDSELNEKIRFLNFILPKEKNVENLIYSVEKIAFENSVGLSKVEFSPGDLSDNSKENFQVTLGVEGFFPNVKNFLTGLKKAPITIEVLRITLDFPENEATESTCIADIALNNYFKPFYSTPEVFSQPLIPISEKERIFLSKIDLNFFPEEDQSNTESYPSSEGRNPF